jgi:hypothetical protein
MHNGPTVRCFLLVGRMLGILSPPALSSYWLESLQILSQETIVKLPLNKNSE